MGSHFDNSGHTKTDFPSDHFPAETRLKIKLAKHRGRPPDKSNEWKSPIKPQKKTESNSMRISKVTKKNKRMLQKVLTKKN